MRLQQLPVHTIHMRSFRDPILTTALVCSLGVLHVSAQAPAKWQEDLSQWRAQRAQNLSAPEGWLTLVGLAWIKPGSDSAGSSPQNSIKLNSHAPAYLGTFKLEKDIVTLTAPAAGFPAGLKIDGKSSQAETLDTGEDHPTRLTYGSLTMIVIHRSGRYYLRVKDAQSPTRVDFKGLNWYAPNPRYRLQAKWIPYTPAKTLTIPNVLGMTTQETAPGIAEFQLNGQTLRLEPLLENPTDTQLFFVLRDTTSKTSTYEAGRFLYTAFPDHGLDKPGTILLDFNRMQNPPCAYTPYATCPLPPPQNRLPVALPAGEKRYRND